MTNAVYPLVVGKTYFKQGFFNVGVDYERYVTNEDEGVTIYVGPQKQSISGRVSRKYNSNATPRVFGGVILRDWFQENFEVLDVVNVEFLSPTQVWLRKQWLRDAGVYDTGGGSVLDFADREELDRLRKEVFQLRQERDILSKAAAWFAQNGGKSTR